MSTTIPLRDIVGVAKYLFLEGIVPLHGHFNAYAVFSLHGKMKHVVKLLLVLIQVLNKGLQTAFVEESIFFTATLLLENNRHARIQKSQFPQAFCQYFILELDVVKRFRRWTKITFGAALFRFARFGKRCYRNTMLVGLLIDFSVTSNG